jgi:hypothetical protein
MPLFRAWSLFRSQQDGVRPTSAGFGIAKNLAQIVDANGARDGKAGVGGKPPQSCCEPEHFDAESGAGFVKLNS